MDQALRALRKPALCRNDVLRVLPDVRNQQGRLCSDDLTPNGHYTVEQVVDIYRRCLTTVTTNTISAYNITTVNEPDGNTTIIHRGNETYVSFNPNTNSTGLAPTGPLQIAANNRTTDGYKIDDKSNLIGEIASLLGRGPFTKSDVLEVLPPALQSQFRRNPKKIYTKTQLKSMAQKWSPAQLKIILSNLTTQRAQPTGQKRIFIPTSRNTTSAIRNRSVTVSG